MKRTEELSTYGYTARLSGNGNTISIRFEYASPKQVLDMINESKNRDQKCNVIQECCSCELCVAKLTELLFAYTENNKTRFEARNIMKYLERILDLCSLIQSHNSYVHNAIFRGVMLPECDCDGLMIKVDGMLFDDAMEENRRGDTVTISKTHFMFKYIFDKLFTIADTEMKAAMLEFNRIHFQQDGFEKMFGMTL